MKIEGTMEKNKQKIFKRFKMIVPNKDLAYDD